MKSELYRKEYGYAVLIDKELPENPLILFEKWLLEATEAKVSEPSAMVLSTVDSGGLPQSRVVLLKNYDEGGFTFFTNYLSNKGIEIDNNPAVAVVFLWPEVERQVRVTGFVTKTSAEISDSYFKSRPLPSQAASIISEQSKKIVSREALEKKLNGLMSNIPHGGFQRPENWGGYSVKPVKIEFWQGRENRLNDRILYEKIGDKWEFSRLQP
ncbi:MAG: pyridoxamine 5'-phosphate oxidase [Draconibacterium sp.]|nr:MAG: pyridoxamine 5'-phosphate oxidase [Draconibacterium sp.]